MKGEAAVEAFQRYDARLASLGFPALSPFAMAEVRRFFLHPTAKTLVMRWGRGAGKSSALVRIAAFLGVFGDYPGPLGEIQHFVIISENVAEATSRLRLLEAILQALGVRYTRVAEVIELVDLPRGFRVVACRVGAASGFRAFGWGADEVAKWPSDPSNPSPAREVIASLRAMTVTHPNAVGIVVSSPMSTVDYHYELVEAGDNEHQIVSIAPTWLANPSVTEARTRELEPDPRIWSREYAAIPQTANSAAFDEAAITRLFEPFEVPADALRGGPILIVDPSSGRSDAWTWAVAQWVSPSHEAQGLRPVYLGAGSYAFEPIEAAEPPDGDSKYLFSNSFNTPGPNFPPTLIFQNIDGLEGRFWQQVPADIIIDKLANICRLHGIRTVIGDQRESLLLTSAFASRGLRYVPLDWTSASKPAAIARLRRWLREGQIKAPLHEKLRRELLSFEEKIAPSGAITFGARGSGHDDYVALLITAAMADEHGLLPSSPLATPIRRALVHLPSY